MEDLLGFKSWLEATTCKLQIDSKVLDKSHVLQIDHLSFCLFVVLLIYLFFGFDCWLICLILCCLNYNIRNIVLCTICLWALLKHSSHHVNGLCASSITPSKHNSKVFPSFFSHVSCFVILAKLWRGITFWKQIRWKHVTSFSYMPPQGISYSMWIISMQAHFHFKLHFEMFSCFFVHVSCFVINKNFDRAWFFVNKSHGNMFHHFLVCLSKHLQCHANQFHLTSCALSKLILK